MKEREYPDVLTHSRKLKPLALAPATRNSKIYKLDIMRELYLKFSMLIFLCSLGLSSAWAQIGTAVSYQIVENGTVVTDNTGYDLTGLPTECTAENLNTQLPAATKDGFAFIEWNTSSDGSGTTVYTLGHAYKKASGSFVNDALKLYGLTRTNYNKITFYEMSATNVATSTKFSSMYTATNSGDAYFFKPGEDFLVPTPTENGKIFSGWYYNASPASSGNNLKPLTGNIIPSGWDKGNINLYGKFTALAPQSCKFYTIKYVDEDDSNVEIASAKLNLEKFIDGTNTLSHELYMESATYFELPVPAREGTDAYYDPILKTFVGWTVLAIESPKEGATNTISVGDLLDGEYNPQIPASLTGNLTLQATFKTNIMPIVYGVNLPKFIGQTNFENTTLFPENFLPGSEKNTISLTDLNTLQGDYHFAGWYPTANLDKKPQQNPASDAHYTAKTEITDGNYTIFQSSNQDGKLYLYAAWTDKDGNLTTDPTDSPIRYNISFENLTGVYYTNQSDYQGKYYQKGTVDAVDLKPLENPTSAFKAWYTTLDTDGDGFLYDANIIASQQVNATTILDLERTTPVSTAVGENKVLLATATTYAGYLGEGGKGIVDPTESYVDVTIVYEGYTPEEGEYDITYPGSESYTANGDEYAITAVPTFDAASGYIFKNWYVTGTKPAGADPTFITKLDSDTPEWLANIAPYLDYSEGDGTTATLSLYAYWDTGNNPTGGERIYTINYINLPSIGGDPTWQPSAPKQYNTKGGEALSLKAAADEVLAKARQEFGHAFAGWYHRNPEYGTGAGQIDPSSNKAEKFIITSLDVTDTENWNKLEFAKDDPFTINLYAGWYTAINKDGEDKDGFDPNDITPIPLESQILYTPTFFGVASVSSSIKDYGTLFNNVKSIVKIGTEAQIKTDLPKVICYDYPFKDWFVGYVQPVTTPGDTTIIMPRTSISTADAKWNSYDIVYSNVGDTNFNPLAAVVRVRAGWDSGKDNTDNETGTGGGGDGSDPVTDPSKATGITYSFVYKNVDDQTSALDPLVWSTVDSQLKTEIEGLTYNLKTNPDGVLVPWLVSNYYPFKSWYVEGALSTEISTVSNKLSSWTSLEKTIDENNSLKGTITLHAGWDSGEDETTGEPVDPTDPTTPTKPTPEPDATGIKYVINFKIIEDKKGLDGGTEYLQNLINNYSDFQDVSYNTKGLATSIKPIQSSVANFVHWFANNKLVNNDANKVTSILYGNTTWANLELTPPNSDSPRLGKILLHDGWDAGDGTIITDPDKSKQKYYVEFVGLESLKNDILNYNTDFNTDLFYETGSNLNLPVVKSNKYHFNAWYVTYNEGPPATLSNTIDVINSAPSNATWSLIDKSSTKTINEVEYKVLKIYPGWGPNGSVNPEDGVITYTIKYANTPDSGKGISWNNPNPTTYKGADGAITLRDMETDVYLFNAWYGKATFDEGAITALSNVVTTIDYKAASFATISNIPDKVNKPLEGVITLYAGYGEDGDPDYKGNTITYTVNFIVNSSVKPALYVNPNLVQGASPTYNSSSNPNGLAIQDLQIAVFDFAGWYSPSVASTSTIYKKISAFDASWESLEKTISATDATKGTINLYAGFGDPDDDTKDKVPDPTDPDNLAIKIPIDFLGLPTGAEYAGTYTNLDAGKTPYVYNKTAPSVALEGVKTFAFKWAGWFPTQPVKGTTTEAHKITAINAEDASTWSKIYSATTDKITLYGGWYDNEGNIVDVDNMDPVTYHLKFSGLLENGNPIPDLVNNDTGKTYTFGENTPDVLTLAGVTTNLYNYLGWYPKAPSTIESVSQNDTIRAISAKFSNWNSLDFEEATETDPKDYIILHAGWKNSDTGDVDDNASGSGIFYTIRYNNLPEGKTASDYNLTETFVAPSSDVALSPIVHPGHNFVGWYTRSVNSNDATREKVTRLNANNFTKFLVTKAATEDEKNYIDVYGTWGTEENPSDKVEDGRILYTIIFGNTAPAFDEANKGHTNPNKGAMYIAGGDAAEGYIDPLTLGELNTNGEYAFAGWYSAKEVSVKNILSPQAISVNNSNWNNLEISAVTKDLTANITIYAGWGSKEEPKQQPDGIQYTVNYFIVDANGNATAYTGKASESFYLSSDNSGNTFTVPTGNGTTFIGWYAELDANVLSNYVGDIFSQDVAQYATQGASETEYSMNLYTRMATHKYNISYVYNANFVKANNPNDATEKLPVATYTYGQLVAGKTLENAIRNYSVFYSWHLEEATGTSVTTITPAFIQQNVETREVKTAGLYPVSTTELNYDVELFANFGDGTAAGQVVYTVSYKLDGDIVETDTYTYTGGKISGGSNPAYHQPTYDANYSSFSGWSLDGTPVDAKSLEDLLAEATISENKASITLEGKMTGFIYHFCGQFEHGHDTENYNSYALLGTFNPSAGETLAQYLDNQSWTKPADAASENLSYDAYHYTSASWNYAVDGAGTEQTISDIASSLGYAVTTNPTTTTTTTVEGTINKYVQLRTVRLPINYELTFNVSYYNINSKATVVELKKTDKVFYDHKKAILVSDATKLAPVIDVEAPDYHILNGNWKTTDGTEYATSDVYTASFAKATKVTDTSRRLVLINTAVPINYVVDYYAEKNSTVKATDISGTPLNSENYTISSAATLPSYATNAYKAGYTWLKWQTVYVGNDVDVDATFDQLDIQYFVADAQDDAKALMNLYPTWKENTYSISYNLNLTHSVAVDNTANEAAMASTEVKAYSNLATSINMTGATHPIMAAPSRWDILDASGAVVADDVTSITPALFAQHAVKNTYGVTNADYVLRLQADWTKGDGTGEINYKSFKIHYVNIYPGETELVSLDSDLAAITEPRGFDISIDFSGTATHVLFPNKGVMNASNILEPQVDYQFNNWTVYAGVPDDGKTNEISSTPITTLAKTSISTDITVYVAWSKNSELNIRYYTMHNGSPDEPELVSDATTKGWRVVYEAGGAQTYTLPSGTAFTNHYSFTGYNFIGWRQKGGATLGDINGNGNNYVLPGTFDTSVDLEAIWDAYKYTIIYQDYDGNPIPGGFGNPTNWNATNNDVTLNVYDSKPGYTADGWYYTDGTTKVTKLDISTLNKLLPTGGEIVLRAKQTAIRYQLAYYNTTAFTTSVQDGNTTPDADIDKAQAYFTNGVDLKSVIYATDFGFEYPTPRRNGYTFLGWTIAVSGGTNVELARGDEFVVAHLAHAAGANNTISLGARWAESTYVIVYENLLNSDNSVNEANIDPAVKYVYSTGTGKNTFPYTTALVAPIRKGWDLNNWQFTNSPSSATAVGGTIEAEELLRYAEAIDATNKPGEFKIRVRANWDSDGSGNGGKVFYAITYKTPATAISTATSSTVNFSISDDGTKYVDASGNTVSSLKGKIDVEHYTFSGWFYGGTSTIATDLDEVIARADAANNGTNQATVTLEGRYTPINYTIKFYETDGTPINDFLTGTSVAGENWRTYTINDDKTTAYPAPYNMGGYKFDGWFTELNGTAVIGEKLSDNFDAVEIAKHPDYTAGQANTLNVYAKRSPYTYRIAYDTTLPIASITPVVNPVAGIIPAGDYTVEALTFAPFNLTENTATHVNYNGSSWMVNGEAGISNFSINTLIVKAQQDATNPMLYHVKFRADWTDKDGDGTGGAKEILVRYFYQVPGETAQQFIGMEPAKFKVTDSSWDADGNLNLPNEATVLGYKSSVDIAPFKFSSWSSSDKDFDKVTSINRANIKRDSYDFYLNVVKDGEYPIYYYSNDVQLSGIEPSKYLTTTTATLPTTLAETNTGYTFAGWTTLKDDFDTKITEIDGTNPAQAGAVTVHAFWQLNEYTVKYFNYQGTEITPDASWVTQYDVENADQLLTNQVPTMNTGYAFKHWAATSGGTEVSLTKDFIANYTFDAKEPNVIKLYEVREPITYYLTFNDNGTGVSYVDGIKNARTFTIETAEKNFINPIRTGFYFEAWASVNDENVTYTSFNTTLIEAEATVNAQGEHHIVLNAIWSAGIYTFVFTDIEGVTNVPSQTFSIEGGSTDKLNLGGLPKRPGYDAKGWYVVLEDGTDLSTPVAILDASLIQYAHSNNNIYIAPRWKDEDGEEIDKGGAIFYAIKYVTEVNGTIVPNESNRTNPEKVSLWTVDKDTPNPVTFGELPILDLESAHHTFNGWYYIDESGNGAEPTLITDKMLDKTFINYVNSTYRTLTLKAEWTADAYRVTYHKMVDDSKYPITNWQQVTTDIRSTITVDSPNVKLGVPNRPGFRFTGWFLDPAFNDTLAVFDGSLLADYAVNGELNIYAKWGNGNTDPTDPDGKEGMITYNFNYPDLPTESFIANFNAANNPVTATIEDFVKGSVQLSELPHKAQFRFIGWYYEADYSGTMIEANTSIYPTCLGFSEFVDLENEKINLYAKYDTNIANEIVYDVKYNFGDFDTDVVGFLPAEGTIGVVYDYKVSDGDVQINYIPYYYDSRFHNAPAPFTFEGWMFDVEDESTLNLYPELNPTVVTDYGIRTDVDASVTLHAAFKEYVPRKFDVELVYVDGDDFTYDADFSIRYENGLTYTESGDAYVIIDPKRPGYQFNGWFLKDDFSTRYELANGKMGYVNFMDAEEAGLIVNNTIKIYAKWGEGYPDNGLINYTVHYMQYLDGKVTELDPSEINGNPATFNVETIHTLADAKRFGWNFTGWFAEPQFENPITQLNENLAAMIAKGETDVYLYARWGDDDTGIGRYTEYTIHYDLVDALDPTALVNNPNDPSGLGVSYNISLGNVTIKDPIRMGAHVSKWYVMDGTNKVDDSAVFATVGGATVYTDQIINYANNGVIYITADWEYKVVAIKYLNVTNDEIVAAANVEQYTYLTSKTSSLNAPVRNGYMFNGWFYDATFTKGTSQIDNNVFAEDKDGDGVVEVYARWGDDDGITGPTPITYQIHFANTNGHNNPNLAAGATFVPYTVEDNDMVLKDMDAPGYVFSGWYLDENYATPITTVDPSITTHAEMQGKVGKVTIYAKWGNGGDGEDGAITYHANFLSDFEMTNPNEGLSMKYDDEYELKDPTAEGYIFTGWDAMFADGVIGKTGVVNFNNKLVPYAYLPDVEVLDLMNIDLKANWILQTYYITFIDAATGQPINKQITYTVDKETDLSLEGLGLQLEREGYVFAGWSLGIEDDVNVFTVLEQGTTGDLTLYAQWARPPFYKIIYNGLEVEPGLVATHDNLEIIEDSANDYILTPASVSGYTFLGWVDEYGDIVTSIPAGQWETVQLWASWELGGDGSGGEDDSIINTPKRERLEVYPTITDGNVTIETEISGGTINIYNASGSLEGTIKMVGNKERHNINEYANTANATYYLNLVGGETKKIIIRK